MSYRGLLVSVYRNNYHDCSFFGESYFRNEFILIGENIPRIQGTDNIYEVLTIKKSIGNTEIPICCQPFLNTAKNGVMFGGNFVYTSDSRFSELVSNSPIKIYDRIEGETTIEKKIGNTIFWINLEKNKMFIDFYDNSLLKEFEEMGFTKKHSNIKEIESEISQEKAIKAISLIEYFYFYKNHSSITLDK